MSRHEQLDASLAALRSEYRAALPARLERIDSLLAAGRLEELERELHTLAGSAGTFGLPAVATAASDAQELLAERPSAREELERLLGVLRHEACVE